MLVRLEDESLSAVWIEYADKLDNLREVAEGHLRKGEIYWVRFNRPKPYQHWYYASLGQLFARRLPQSARDENAEFQKLVELIFGSARPPANLVLVDRISDSNEEFSNG
jgi:hypothetical protein